MKQLPIARVKPVAGCDDTAAKALVTQAARDASDVAFQVSSRSFLWRIGERSLGVGK